MNANPKLAGILPGLVYLTGEQPENKVLIWSEPHKQGEIQIVTFEGTGAVKPPPARALESIRNATVVGYGPASALDEQIHQVCALYLATDIPIIGRYRVHDGWCHHVSAGPFDKASPSMPLPYKEDRDLAELELGSGLVQARFQVAAAEFRLQLEIEHPEDGGIGGVAMHMAGMRYLEQVKDGTPVRDLDAQQTAQLRLGLANGPGFSTAMDLSLIGEPDWLVEQWQALLAAVTCGFAPLPASLLAMAAWRAHRPLLARRAVDLAAKWATGLLPPVHEITEGLIRCDIHHLATSG